MQITARAISIALISYTAPVSFPDRARAQIVQITTRAISIALTSHTAPVFLGPSYYTQAEATKQKLNLLHISPRYYTEVQATTHDGR